MPLAVCGGLLTMAWNVLSTLRLFQLARANEAMADTSEILHRNNTLKA